MPNWCSNTLLLKHTDSEMLNRAIKAFNNEKLFEEFFPCPEELLNHDESSLSEERRQELLDKYQASDWYYWRIANWGVKWDVGNAESVDTWEETAESGNKVYHALMNFESAWGPPVTGYAKLETLGFEITARYYEPGMMFCGEFSNGDDQYFEIEGDSEWVCDNIPSEIDQEFGISEFMREMEEPEVFDPESEQDDE